MASNIVRENCFSFFIMTDVLGYLDICMRFREVHIGKQRDYDKQNIKAMWTSRHIVTVAKWHQCQNIIVFNQSWCYKETLHKVETTDKSETASKWLTTLRNISTACYKSKTTQIIARFAKCHNNTCFSSFFRSFQDQWGVVYCRIRSWWYSSYSCQFRWHDRRGRTSDQTNVYRHICYGHRSGQQTWIGQKSVNYLHVLELSGWNYCFASFDIKNMGGNRMFSYNLAILISNFDS